MTTMPAILHRASTEGYAVFTKGEMNVNIVAVRSPNRRSNLFDDLLYVSCKLNDIWRCWVWTVTTDPGTYWLKNPGRREGTAILCPGQYRGVYKIAKHRGKYDALCQRNGRVRVWRDNTRDEILDWDKNDPGKAGSYGINIHRASSSRTSTRVDRWSAGCTVFANPSDFQSFMKICKKAAARWGNSFTYTLLEDK